MPEASDPAAERMLRDLRDLLGVLDRRLAQLGDDRSAGNAHVIAHITEIRDRTVELIRELEEELHG
jgi:sugar-specific transcriptional regulator TrmB